MSEQMSSSPGFGSSWPVEPGARIQGNTARFTLFCRSASRVHLLLFDHPRDAGPAREITLEPDTHRSGDIWQVVVENVQPGMAYVYWVEHTGPDGPAPDQWLLDPWARAVCGRTEWGHPGHLKPGHWPLNGPDFPKGVLLEDHYDWEGDRPLNRPLEDTVLYEIHLRGFTAHPSSGVRHPGTYEGLIEKLPYLLELGVNAVELMPIQEFDEMEYYLENKTRGHLRNFWGYSTLNFFAPNGRYAACGPVEGGQVNAFRDLVKALHGAGIEVILDVVFNHTAELDAEGPTYSFRGLDRDLYYLLDRNGTHYSNFTGCGNTLNANHPAVQDFILASLRYWVLDLHVDGFRFDLASALTRGQDGKPLTTRSVIDRIAEDPVLCDTKLIAEAWDAAGLYQVGSFPHRRWSEWNGRYRDDIRKFWNGEPGLLGTLASRLVGSPDLYDRNGQAPRKSINFITCHDGFTLHDLVSYSQKHNQANGEDNRDGEEYNHSCGHGAEGPSRDPAVRARRLAKQKCLLGTLLLSQGVPMLLAGDEFGRSQHGNNNAYCQDNESAWVDWCLLETHDELYGFTRRLLALRKSFTTLRRDIFPDDRQHGRPAPPIEWRSARGHTPDWAHGRRLGLVVFGDRARSGLDHDLPDLFLVFNAEAQDHHFFLPQAVNQDWHVELSSEPTPPRISKSCKTLHVAPHSLTVLSTRSPDDS